VTVPTRIAIIGYGRFGRLLADILKDDFEVCVHGRRDIGREVADNVRAVSLDEALSCETIFYAVPISRFEEVLRSHLPFLRDSSKPKVLIDVLSVKLYPKKVFEELLPAHIHAMLTHPMFGPDSVRAMGLAGLPMVLDRFTLPVETYDFWKNYFSAKKLRIIEMPADQHDRLAAYSQGVAHFIGRILEEMKMTETSIDTLGAKKLLEIKEQTCHDSWELFTDLQVKNPYTVEMRVQLGDALDNVYSKLLPNRLDKDTLVVGVQGGRGSFNEAAALYYLKRNDIKQYRVVYLYTTLNVLAALHSGNIDRGQFAIHNSIGGIVDESIEAMAQYKFRIAEQFSIKIRHALMIRADAALEEIDTVMTHPQVVRQCKTNLAEKYGRLKLVSGEGDLIDPAKVAEQLGERKLPKTIATMGGALLAEIYGLKVVEDDLQDLRENYTSFLWVERW
jgi:prephenate dehydrogenase